MRVTLFMAMSVNGTIARPDFREDFLGRENWDSFLHCAQEAGAMMWGRKTHEKVRRYGPRYFEALADLHNIVVSANPHFTAHEPGFEVARSPEEAVQRLEAHGCTAVVLAGGSILNGAAASAGLIDDLVLNVEAVVIGTGIPLFAPGAPDLRLRPDGVRPVSDRVLQLRFSVLR